MPADHPPRPLAAAAPAAIEPPAADPSTIRHARRRRIRRALALVGLAVFGGAVGSVVTSAVGASHDFVDIPTSHAFHDDIAWLARSGITRGYTDGTFRATEPVSRQSMAAFLRRSFGAISTRTQTFTTDGATVHVVVVDCPPGKRPIAGSGRIVSAPSGSKPVLIASGPTVQGSGGWTVSWRTATSASVTGQGQVTCIPA